MYFGDRERKPGGSGSGRQGDGGIVEFDIGAAIRREGSWLAEGSGEGGEGVIIDMIQFVATRAADGPLGRGGASSEEGSRQGGDGNEGF